MPRKLSNPPAVEISEGDFFIPKPLALTRIDIDREQPNIVHTGGVRVFKDSPESVCLQIRTAGRLTGTHGGKCRPSFSTTSLTYSEVDELIKLLTVTKRKLEVRR